MMEQPQRNKSFQIETFALEDQQFLYEIEVNGHNSILKLYNNEGKLRSNQRMKLPANCQVYPCEHYIIVLTVQQIHLYQISNINLRCSCANPGIQHIELVRYNKYANLIFFLNPNNQLYYLMPEITSIQVKKIFSCQQHKINGRITRLETDHRSIVKLLCAENRMLYCLKFNWNNNDALQNMYPVADVVDVYCREKWSLLVRVNRDEESNYVVDIIDENSMIDGSKFTNYVPIFPPDELPIVKSTTNYLIYLDKNRKALMVIYKKEQIYQKDFEISASKFSNNTLLFEIKKKSWNALNLVLHSYVGMGESFKSAEVPLKLLDMEEEETTTLMYIHNNIHLILTGGGVERHFSQKVRQFLQLDAEDNPGDEKLTCMLLGKLLEKSPLTIIKLSNHFRKQNQHTYLPSLLYRYLEYLSIILYEIPFIKGLHEVPETEQERFLSQIDPNKAEEYNAEYKTIKIKLQSMITFTSMILYAIKQERMNSNKHHDKKEMRDEGAGDCNQYYRIVERCKTVYILNEIYNSYVKDTIDKIVNSQKMRQAMNIMKMEVPSIIVGSKISEIIEQEEDPTLKIGKPTCHQVFNQNLKKKVSVKEILKYLADCNNFYHAAYFYLVSFPEQREVPYIGDDETIQLIKFLIEYPVSVLNNRQNLRKMLKSLPKMAARALILNEPAFLQYVCSLSVNASEYKSCLAILISGVGKQWDQSTHPFLIECLIMCDRTALAYSYVQQLGKSDGGYRRQLMQQFTSRCIKQKKVKDLLEISKSGEDDTYIRQELNKTFGDDVKEIIELMEGLNNQS